jgi:hypothetical protein
MLERLAAIEEIKVLKARYFRFVDTQAWGDLRTLFTDDATLFFPESRPEPAPLDVVIAAASESLKGAVTVHHGHMPEIESPDEARGIWAMEDRLYFPPGGAGMKGASVIKGVGHYHETYARQDGGWRIRTLKLTRLRFDVRLAPRAVL